MNLVIKDFKPEGLAALHLPKEVVSTIPPLGDPRWVKRPAGHWFLPLMFDVSGGIAANVLHYPTPGLIGRHAHDGPVFAYTIEGSWFYPEHDWVAEAGTFVWEPTGDVHSFTVKESMTAVFIMHGGMVIVDEDDKPIGYENCLSLLGYCDQYYRDQGLGEDFVKQFIR
jgi:2,4'-dihydroxyacetophenone dioxygenase